MSYFLFPISYSRFYFQELLRTILNNSIPLRTDDDITCAIESFNNWSTTLISSNSKINIEYSLAIKEKGSRKKGASQAIAD